MLVHGLPWLALTLEMVSSWPAVALWQFLLPQLLFFGALVGCLVLGAVGMIQRLRERAERTAAPH